MKDFLLDSNNDILIANGDLVIGESDKQHQLVLLLATKGSFKEFPDTGVGAFDYLESEGPEELYTEIRRQFAADGMTVNQVGKDENGKIQIDASY